MLNAITLRPLTENDLAHAAALMNAEYARKKNEDYFRWQYFTSYYSAVLMGAFKDNTLIGMFGLQKKQLTNGAWAGQAMDLLITPPWRGKGLFRQMGDRALTHFDDLDLFCVFPNPQGKLACERTLGWTTIGKIDSLSISREEFEKFEKEELKELQLNFLLNKNTEASFLHTDAYHAWRFEQSVEYAYQYVKLTPVLYAATKVFIDPVSGARYGDIVDVEYGDSSPETIHELYLLACKSLLAQNVGSVTTWALPHTPLFRIAQTAGFTALPRERYFCVRVLNDRCHILSNIISWNFTQADCEMY